MLVYRFMSKDEYEKLIKGKELKNDWVHDGHTDSIGFCFMPYEQDKPEDAYQYLSGIVSPEVCVVFSTSHPMKKRVWYICRLVERLGSWTRKNRIFYNWI